MADELHPRGTGADPDDDVRAASAFRVFAEEVERDGYLRGVHGRRRHEGRC